MIKEIWVESDDRVWYVQGNACTTFMRLCDRTDVCWRDEWRGEKKKRMEMLKGWIPKSKLPDQRLGSFKRKKKKTPIRKQLLLTEARHKQNNIVQFHGPPSKTSLMTLTRRQRRDAVAITKWQRFWIYTQINNACWHCSPWHIAC